MVAKLKLHAAVGVLLAIHSGAVDIRKLGNDRTHLARSVQVLGLEPPHNLCKGRGALPGNYGQFGLAQLGERDQHAAAIFFIAVAFHEPAAL